MVKESQLSSTQVSRLPSSVIWLSHSLSPVVICIQLAEDERKCEAGSPTLKKLSLENEIHDSNLKSMGENWSCGHI